MSQGAVIRLLKDGSGRVCIHYFHRAPTGPIKTAAGVTMTVFGPMQMGGAVGKIACQPKLADVTPKAGYNGTVPMSDDPRAVTCPACIASAEWQQMMAELAEYDGEQQRNQEALCREWEKNRIPGRRPVPMTPEEEAIVAAAADERRRENE